MQNEYLLFKIDFQSENFVLNDFWKQQMHFLTLDKIIILDNSVLSWPKNILSEQKDEALDV